MSRVRSPSPAPTSAVIHAEVAHHSAQARRWARSAALVQGLCKFADETAQITPSTRGDRCATRSGSRSGVRVGQHRGPGVCPGRSAACADPVRHVDPADSRRRERRYCPGARGGHGCELINERRQGPTTRLTLTQIVYTSCKVLLEATWLSAQAVITFRGDTYRVMSLRHASRRERRLYGEAFNE